MILGIPFDEQHLEQLISNADFGSMSGLNIRIMEALDAHRGDQAYQDDIALVSCRFI